MTKLKKYYIQQELAQVKKEGFFLLWMVLQLQIDILLPCFVYLFCCFTKIYLYILLICIA